MQSDTLKIIAAYVTALVIIIGGFLFLYATRLDNAGDLRLAVVGFMGSAIGYVFVRDTQAGSARQSERAFAAGQSNPNPNPTDPQV